MALHSLSNVRAESPPVQVSGAGQWLPLAPGLQVFGPTDRYVWSGTDFDVDQNLHYWQPYPGPGWPGVSYGKATFEVQEAGIVYLATTAQFGSGGNPSGDWLPEVIYRDELEAEGWSVVGNLRDRDTLGSTDAGEWLLFQRSSTAGEVFTYRTHKYNPPILMTTAAVTPLTPFRIDATESTFELSATLGDAVLIEQQAGSLVANITGSLLVDLSNPGSLSINANSRFELLDQPGVFQPGDSAADLAGLFVAQGSSNIPAYIRGLTGAVEMPTTLLEEDGSFNVFMTIDPLSGRFAVEMIPGATVSIDLDGTLIPPRFTPPGKLENLGDRLKLTIPLSYANTFDTGALEFPGSIQGQIVAYAIVPEAKGLLLMSLAGVAGGYLACVKRRKTFGKARLNEAARSR